MAAKTATYSLITSQVLSSTSVSVTITSIPSTFTDLVLVVQTAQPSSTGELYIRFNSDTGTNHSYTSVTGDVTSVGANRTSNGSVIFAGHLGTSFMTSIIDIFDYANTNKWKTTVLRGSNADRVVGQVSGQWRSTSAVTSIFLSQMNSGTNLFVSGSTFRLYGIEAGNL